MKRFILYFSFIVFVFYWLVTIFFVWPDNPLNLKKMEQYQYFDLYFFQRWGFFAPPPTSNDRLYFSYYYIDEKKNLKTNRIFDVLTPIIKDKKEAIPFNRKEEVIEYIISHGIIGIQNNLKELSDLENLKKDNLNHDKKIHLLVSDIEKTNDFKILFNYAKFIAQTNNLPIKNGAVQIILTNISIPQFIDKDKKSDNKEKIIFSSNIHRLNE